MGIFFCIFDYQFRSEGKCQSLTQHIALKTLVWFRPTADDIGNNGSGSDGFITSTGGQRYVPTLLCTTLFPSSSSSPPARHSALSFTSYFILTHFPCDFHPFPSSVLTLRSSSSLSHPYTIPLVPILSKIQLSLLHSFNICLHFLNLNYCIPFLIQYSPAQALRFLFPWLSLSLPPPSSHWAHSILTYFLLLLLYLTPLLLFLSSSLLYVNFVGDVVMCCI